LTFDDITRMSNGEYHTGKKHGVRSKPLELR